MDNWTNVNKYQPIKAQLDNELNAYMKQNPTKTISSSRRAVLEKAKEQGLINDFRFNTSRGGQPQPNHWGGSAGFDNSFTIFKI